MQSVAVMRSMRLLVACGACLLSVSCSRPDVPSRPSSARNPLLTFLDSDFGTAWEQPMFVHAIHVKNRSNEPLRIVNIERSCSCAVADPRGELIPPGEVLPIDVTLDLMDHRQPLPRNFQTSLILTVADSAGNLHHESVQVAGFVQASPFAVRFPMPDEFETVIRGVNDDVPRTILLEAMHEVEILHAETDGSVVAAAEVLPASAEGEYQLSLQLASEIPLGQFEGLVRLRMAGGADRDERLLNIPVRGRIVTDSRTFPSEVSWGVRPVGTQVEDYLTFSTRSGRQIASVRPHETPDMTVEPAVVSENLDGPVYRVESVVDRVGLTERTLRFDVWIEGDTAPHRLDVPISVFGRAASATTAGSP
jgi:hypothetical protein